MFVLIVVVKHQFWYMATVVCRFFGNVWQARCTNPITEFIFAWTGAEQKSGAGDVWPIYVALFLMDAAVPKYICRLLTNW